MSLNPLNELKRHLDNDTILLPKRLCLARNVVQSHNFPTAPKERVVAEWLECLTSKNKLSSNDLHGVLEWLNLVDDLTSDLKSTLIEVVSQYVQRNPLHNNDLLYILSFLENSKISLQISQDINEYLSIMVKSLQCLKNEETANIALCQKILNNMIKYYKESKRKLEFIVKFIDGDKLETIFSYLDTDCRETIIELCRNVLFPINKKSYFISFLQTLIRKDNIDDLIAEKGDDNIQSVLKIMSVFFEFPKQRTDKDPQFLHHFIDVFVSCFFNESQVIFAFYIMAANVLNMKQNYIIPLTNMTSIVFEEKDDKIKRKLMLSMLQKILQNEVDMSVRLTDTFGEKISKVEIKKNFMSFMQAVLMEQLKLTGKPDKTTLQIIKTALKLDPILIEQKIEKILPPIMTMKKHTSAVKESYTEMINCLLEILFKLGRGTVFINQILPFVKSNLELCNTEQFELKQRVKECIHNKDYEKLNNKIITGNDIFPQECAELFGKLTSDLMFRQNKELLKLLQKDLEEYCLMMLEEGFVSPSIITIAEILSAVLSTFLRHNKMADHTVPQVIAEDFWNMYKTFEEECLKKFGECILKLSYNQPVVLAFLKLCLSFSQLKLLNIKYSNVKLEVLQVKNTSEVFDLSILLPCLTSEQWITLASRVQADGAVLILDNLLLLKAMALDLMNQVHKEISNESISTKRHLIKQINTNPNILTINNYFPRILFTNLDNSLCKHLSECLIKLFLINQQTDIFDNVATMNNRCLLNYLVLETAKNITKCFENCDLLTKALNETDFNMAAFAKQVDMKNYFNQIILKSKNQDDTIKKCLEIIKLLQLAYLEENYQITAIFVLLALKKSCQTKKIRRNIDYVLQAVYELSPQHPDLYQIFPVDFIFFFEDKTMMDLLTLQIKTSYQFFVIKSILESAVKRVRTDSHLVKNIVDILLSKTSCKSDTLMDSFSNPAFQISCIILPLIVKQKKAITASAYRSILADLQEKLQKSLLESFKNLDFDSQNGSLFDTTVNSVDYVIDSKSNVATLNAMAAYSLTLSRYCETTDMEEIKNLDCLLSGFGFFIQNAIKAIQKPDSKHQYIKSSTHLLNVILRHIKKFESHSILKEKDKLFTQIWQSIKARLLMVYEQEDVVCNSYLEDIAVTLKFICELSSVECYVNNFVGDLTNLTGMKKPSLILKDNSTSEITSHRVSKYLWGQCLKANIVGPKCVAMSKSMYQNCSNLRLWIRQHYELERDIVANRKRKNRAICNNDENENIKIHNVPDLICIILKVDLDTLSEVIFAGKKISLDYKFLDCIFELQHMVHYILGCNTSQIRCEVSWQAFFTLFEGCIAVLNSLIVSREEILEDRWPCYMQCYRALVTSLCERSTSNAQLDKAREEKLAEIAHLVEKLTQSICKRKKQVSRIAAYSVADICTSIERTAPARMVRQHLENSVALLIQASDSTYAISFLNRTLAGSTGQITMTNLYTMYKRYHKYVGNS